jgi:hypothetical protein
MKPVSIDASKLYKGQTIPSGLAWDHYVNRRPDQLEVWIQEHGDEESAKLARLPYVLLKVRDWLDQDRQQMELPPLVMNTVGGVINVLTDERASVYLGDQAFQGLRRHQRATSRLLTAVDETRLSSAARREHQNRINVHSFILASAQGAQNQLRVLKRAGKEPPRLG